MKGCFSDDIKLLLKIRKIILVAKNKSATMNDDERVIRLYEARLEKDIQKLDIKIKELTESRQVLKRLLVEARGRGGFEPVVKRRNSTDRVIIESAIRRSLYGKTSVKSRDIYDQVKKVSYDLKHSTFRSYLHRMKEKGIISQHGRGAWTLS